jgi:hypothetical protein
MEFASADPEWAVGFEDECWWSRVALPTLSAWSADGEALRLIQRSVSPRTTPSRRPCLVMDCTFRRSTRRG